MLIEELMGFLQTQKGQVIEVILQGIIIANVFIENMQARQEEKSLILENKKNLEISIGFNLKQLMKITKLQENEILLEFDQLQNAIIKTKDKIKKAITSKSNSYEFFKEFAIFWHRLKYKAWFFSGIVFKISLKIILELCNLIPKIK